MKSIASGKEKIEMDEGMEESHTSMEGRGETDSHIKGVLFCFLVFYFNHPGRVREAGLALRYIPKPK